MAAAHSQGPGTFAAQIIDALYSLDEAALAGHAKIEISK
jgi:hydroxyethylthiazole kinase-like sugar kinase family protein